MENISYGKIVLIGAGHVGSAILDSLLRMNLADEIVVINRNEKKALGVVLDASHTTAFAYSANANIRVGTYEDCKDAQIIINTAGPSIQPGNSRDRMVLLQTNVQVMKEIMTQITTYTRSAIIINVSNPMDILTYIAQKEFNYPRNLLIVTIVLSIIIYRPFCRYICPLGAFYSVFNKVSIYRYRVDMEKCVHCGKCAKACQMVVNPVENPNSPECIRCGRCKQACPVHAIASGCKR